MQNDNLNLEQPYYEMLEDSYFMNDLLLSELPDEFWRTLEEGCTELEDPISEEALNEGSDDQGLFSPNDASPGLLKKRPWTYEEDKKLKELLEEYGGPNQWLIIGQKMGTRNGKQCRERYHNHLSPFVKKEPWTKEEDDKILKLYEEYGSKWVQYREALPGRTDHAIKNRWHLLKRNEKPKPPRVKRSISESSTESNFEDNLIGTRWDTTSSSESVSSLPASRSLSASSFREYSEINTQQIATESNIPLPIQLQPLLIPTTTMGLPGLQIAPPDEFSDLDTGYQQRTPMNMTPVSMMSSDLPPAYSPYILNSKNPCTTPFGQDVPHFPRYDNQYLPSAPVPTPTPKITRVAESPLFDESQPYLIQPAMIPMNLLMEGSIFLQEVPSSPRNPNTPKTMKRNKMVKKKVESEKPQLWKGSYFA